MNNTVHLSNLLAAKRAEILAHWMQRIGAEHSDKDLSRGELRDHLPMFFDEVLAALGVGESSPDENASVTTSAAHGTQRLRVGFDLRDVIREYEILTECILDEIEALAGSVSIRHFRRVQRLLNAGRAEAVSAYVDGRDTEVARAHSQHVAFVAHELRGPLMTAFIATAALRKQAVAEDEWALTLLTRNLAALRDLIDQVLTADRLAAGVSVRREPLDLRELIEQLVAEIRVAAEQRKVKVHVDAPDALPYSGDRRLLRSAISNILQNAVKFTQEGGAIEVRSERRTDHIVIEVEDACGGLPVGNPAELFEPFVQRNEDRTGFGLGLAIVKQAMDAHHGRAVVRNLPHKGCVFSLELPLAQGD